MKPECSAIIIVSYLSLGYLLQYEKKKGKKKYPSLLIL